MKFSTDELNLLLNGLYVTTSEYGHFDCTEEYKLIKRLQIELGIYNEEDWEE